MLLNAAKDVTAALSDLINATKNASGKSANDPAMDSLKSAAKVGQLLLLLLCIVVVIHCFPKVEMCSFTSAALVLFCISSYLASNI